SGAPAQPGESAAPSTAASAETAAAPPSAAEGSAGEPANQVAGLAAGLVAVQRWTVPFLNGDSGALQGGLGMPPSAKEGDTGATVDLPLGDVIHPVAASPARPAARFRLPEFDRLTAAYTANDLKIPETAIKNRVGQ